MTFESALQEDILSVLPFGGPFKSGYEVAKLVAPLREREVRTILYKLSKQGVLTLNRGGGGWAWYYGRLPLRRRRLISN